MATNVIDIDVIASKPAPSDEFGYIVFNIGSAKVISPTAHGAIITIVKNNENDNLLFAVSVSFFARDAAIAGTSAVQNAAFIAKGSLIIVSTFEIIPESSIAFCSNASFVANTPENAVCIHLLTVIVSIVPFSSATSEPIVIGIDIANIIFKICLVVFSSVAVV